MDTNQTNDMFCERSEFVHYKFVLSYEISQGKILEKRRRKSVVVYVSTCGPQLILNHLSINCKS